MRVVNSNLGFMTPRVQTGGSVINSTNSNFQNLRQELEMHREAERRILGFLESHSDDGGRQLNFGESCGGGDNVSNTGFLGLHDGRRVDLRGHSDQCFGPSTNSSRKAPPTCVLRGAGYLSRWTETGV